MDFIVLKNPSSSARFEFVSVEFSGVQLYVRYVPWFVNHVIKLMHIHSYRSLCVVYLKCWCRNLYKAASTNSDEEVGK
jgi:hypothetical protein